MKSVKIFLVLFSVLFFSSLAFAEEASENIGQTGIKVSESVPKTTRKKKSTKKKKKSGKSSKSKKKKKKSQRAPKEVSDSMFRKSLFADENKTQSEK